MCVSECVFSSMWIYFILIWSSCYITPVTGEPQVIGSSQTVVAKVGDEAILPCHIEPSVNTAKMTVKWTRPDLKPEYVNMLQDGHVISQSLNPLYRQRTSLFHDELSHGNISLKISRVQLSDEGTFKCFVPKLQSSALIQLLVGSVSQPVISLNGPEDNGLSLTCDSGCWYPQPELSWLDSEGDLLPVEPSVVDRLSQYCYAVRTNVTVTQPGNLTCRVYLLHINHTADVHKVIPAEGTVETRGTDRMGITEITVCVVSVVVVVLMLVAVMLVYSYRKKHSKTKQNSDSPRYHKGEQEDNQR